VFLLFLISRSFSISPNSFDSEGFMEYASPFETIDYTIDFLCEEYPTMCVIGEQRKNQFKKEFLEFYALPEEQQREIIAGFPSHFKVLSEKFREPGKITKKEFAELIEKGEHHPENEFEYFMHVVIQKPAEKLITRNKAEC
ncbi:hypothetical protein PFISCL1PPCAC_19019, partial [Pristionchus fissidentatus]